MGTFDYLLSTRPDHSCQDTDPSDSQVRQVEIQNEAYMITKQVAHRV